MKVLHATEVEAGGTISVMAHLIDHQTHDARVSSVLCIAPIASRDMLFGAGLCGFLAYKRTGRNIPSFVRLLSTLAKTVLKERPDVVHLHSTYAGFLGRFFLTPLFLWRRTKVVYCPHGYAFLMEGAPSQKVIFSALERLLSKFPQKIICVSQYERDAALAVGIRGKKIDVVYNGVDDASEASSKTGPDSNVVEYVFLGRNDRAKGFDVLLQAMALVRGNSRVRLTVVGIAADEIAETHGLPNVYFMGWLDATAVKHQLKRCDVLVLPSRWEGFPMAALEAMSAGLPVLASSCTSIPEAVEHGVNGFIVPVGDSRQLADVMAHTPLEVWRTMGSNARAKYERQYRASKMTKATFDVYLSMFN